VAGATQQAVGSHEHGHPSKVWYTADHLLSSSEIPAGTCDDLVVLMQDQQLEKWMVVCIQKRTYHQSNDSVGVME